VDLGEKSLSVKDLSGWEPQGTTLAFIGRESEFHAAIHATAIANLATLKPELGNWNVRLIQTGEEDLAEVMKILHQKRIWGLIFTAPLKSAGLKLLSPVMLAGPQSRPGLGGADATAERVGAVNLAMWRPNGYWGVSTDGAAISWFLSDHWKIDFNGRNVVIFGAGAMGRAAAVEALSQGCRELWMGNRTQERTWDAIEQILPSPMMRARTHGFNMLKPSAKIPRMALIINALPLSARGTPTAPLKLEYFDRGSAYLDLVPAPTPQLEEAKKLKLTAMGGQRILAWQARHHVEFLTGVRADFDTLLWVVNELGAKKSG